MYSPTDSPLTSPIDSSSSYSPARHLPSIRTSSSSPSLSLSTQRISSTTSSTRLNTSNLSSPRSHSSNMPTAVPYSENGAAKEVFQAIINGRRSWKTLRGGDLVWPPELEEALLEGLSQYIPDDSRETRLLGRFPRRNRFISDYIQKKTGKLRTPKQVGSRLQQLRDTSGGKQLLKLLCPSRRESEQCISPVSPTDYYSASPTTPTSPSFPPPHAHQSGVTHTVVTIEVLPPPSSPAHPLPLPESTPCACTVYPLTPSSSREQNGNEETATATEFFRPSSRARHLGCIEPVVSFVKSSSSSSSSPHSSSSSTMVNSCYSFFTVVERGVQVHKETVPLDVRPLEGGSGGGEGDVDVYSTRLVPGYWDVICASDDPTQYSIYQSVAYSHSDFGPAETIFKATYKFAYPCSSPYAGSSRSTLGSVSTSASGMGSGSGYGSGSGSGFGSGSIGSGSRSSAEPASPITPTGPCDYGVGLGMGNAMDGVSSMMGNASEHDVLSASAAPSASCDGSKFGFDPVGFTSAGLAQVCDPTVAIQGSMHGGVGYDYLDDALIGGGVVGYSHSPGMVGSLSVSSHGSSSGSLEDMRACYVAAGEFGGVY